MKRSAIFLESNRTFGCRPLFCPNGINMQPDAKEDHGPIPTYKESQALLSRDLLDLSAQERERVEEEVHGIARPLEETPSLISESLEQLDEEISKVRKKNAYGRALFLSPTFVKDHDFLLMFLRCEQFDIPRTAKRIVNHFEVKLELFGIDKLVKNITLNDLDKDDIDSILGGTICFQKEKDQSGRTILFCHQTNLVYKTVKNMLRAYWYQAMVAAEDEQTQRNGIVSLFFNADLECPPKIDKDLFFSAPKMTSCLPQRFVSRHYCYSNANLKPILSLLAVVIKADGRVRFRTHFGTRIECLYSLLTYGISCKHLPFDESGEIKVPAANYLIKRRAIEMKRDELKATSGNIKFPISDDVVLGRGIPYQQFPGNLKLANIVDSLRQKYKEVDRLDKTIISKEIVLRIKSNRGRFLKRNIDENGNPIGWIEVSDETARNKVSHAFRTRTRQSLLQQSETQQQLDKRTIAMRTEKTRHVEIPVKGVSMELHRYETSRVTSLFKRAKLV